MSVFFSGYHSMPPSPQYSNFWNKSTKRKLAAQSTVVFCFVWFPATLILNFLLNLGRNNCLKKVILCKNIILFLNIREFIQRTVTTVAIASQRNTNSVFCIVLLGTFSLLSSTQVGKCSDGGHDSLISYPDLLSKKIQFFVWLDCERMTRVSSSARAMACAIHSLQSFQY